MTPLSRKDNDLLRNQEWRLLFGLASSAAHAPSTSAHGSGASLPSEGQLPATYAQDTFLVKSVFSETEKYYLILVTNLKQCWYEKLEIEDIRQRSKKIKSFAYEEDSQLEALLLSLSAIFATTEHHDTASAASTFAKRIIEIHDDKLPLFVEFDFGLATAHWEFKLSPMIQATLSSHKSPSSSELELSDNDEPLLRRTSSKSKRKADATTNRIRNFLEDSDVDDEDIDGDDDHGNNATGKRAGGVDGMSVMFDHLLLPLISLTNAYRKQVKSLEAVIKSKENEVVEALEMLEQSGVAYHNRRKATERYDKAHAEARLQEGIEQLIRPRLVGPKELFSEKNIPVLCSVVSRNAADQDATLPSLTDKEGVLSQGASSSSQTAPGLLSSKRTGAGSGADGATISLHGYPATAMLPTGEEVDLPESASTATKQIAQRVAHFFYPPNS
ncbi:hypothetical protein BGZ58_009866 [Dissophora ornata]|nr:hypothetical protein BGZ58_009866 [Dissophora ornata]